jgi:hypothetical protein
MTIQIGNRVRSFDFHYMRDLEGPRSCYMEGEVIGFEEVRGCTRYVIKVDRCVSGGKERSDFPEVIYPPVNGTPTTMGRVTDGVELLGTTPAFDMILAS